MPDQNSAFVQEGGPDEEADHSSVIVHVPVQDLAQGGTPPDEGDEVEFSVKGTIRYVEGEIACLSVTEINGQPVSEPASSPGEEGGEDQDEQKLKQAMGGLGGGQPGGAPGY